MDAFKIPQAIPQDLLLIQEFIDVPEPGAAKVIEGVVSVKEEKDSEDEDIGSSASEDEDEEEIAADLTKGGATDDDDVMKGPKADSESEPSDSSEDTSSESESDSSEGEEDDSKKVNVYQDLEDDEDPVPASTSGTYFTTKHEVAESTITIPEVDQVGLEEALEKVGEVMTIIDQVVIVRGLPSEFLNRASERALDSDTLLIFDDRKVMGYIYETFGPTMQPLYQVKFNSSFPLDPDRVRVGREVFHVPARSNFVFVSQIKAFRGSDASNVHDEEPADDELEFSDDEAEAAYRSRLKRKRAESRGRSAASSRASTPNPTMLRDQELAAADEAFFSRNAYDEHGPYDIDYSAPGPSSSASSRPAPIPYDDPYGDEYTAPDLVERESRVEPTLERRPSFDHARPPRGRGRGGRGRGDGSGGRERGRGGGGGRGRDRGPRGRGDSRQRGGREMSPTSLAIARATGQGGFQQPGGHKQQQQQYQEQEYSPLYPDQSMIPMSMQLGSQQQQQQQGGFSSQAQAQAAFMQMQAAAQYAVVQPHINPRFASAFGLSMYGQQQQGYGNINPMAQQQAYGQSQVVQGGNWSDEWTVPVQGRFMGGASGEGQQP